MPAGDRGFRQISGDALEIVPQNKLVAPMETDDMVVITD